MFCLALLLCGAALVAAWPPSVAAQEDKKEKKADNPASETPPRVSQENLLTTSALFNTYRQIVIEGLVVEVDSTEARQWGIEMFYQRNPGNLGGGGNLSGAVLRTPNTFPLGGVPSLDTSVNPPEVNLDSQPIGAGATFDSFETDTFLFQTRVRAAVIGGKANILSQPIAVTQSGMEVNLSTVDEIPFQDIVVDAYQATIIPDYQKELGAVRADFKDFTAKKAGITLKVTPQLLPPERIQLDISTLDVGQLAGFIYVRGVARPIIEHSTLETQVELADGESLLISGIKTTKDTSVRRGIPVLKNLPVLGLLFGSNTVLHEQVDILFMITPHLLRPGQNPLAPRDFQNKDFLLAQ